MTLRTIPNIEAVMYDHLGDHPDLVLLDARVAGSLPSDQAGQVKPWVKVTQLDATDVGGVEHLIDYLVQFDCYAGADATREEVGQAEASLLARTVRAALKDMQGQTIDGAVINGVSFQGMARIPDTDFERTRERVVLTAQIHAHAVSA